MLLSRNKKNNVYPCKPQFYYIKVGFKGVKIIWACFCDEFYKLDSVYTLVTLKVFRNVCIFMCFTIRKYNSFTMSVQILQNLTES